MLVNKFLAAHGQLPATKILDQFYKEPTLPALANEDVVARAIQLGVQDGALGLAEVHDDEVDVETLRYDEEIPLLTVSFDESVYVLSRERCEALLAQVEPEEEDVGAGVEVTGTGEVGAVEPGVEEEPEPKPESAVKPTEKRYHRVRLVVADVPASKIAGVNRGVFMPLSQAAGEATFTMEIEVTSEEGISDSTLEQKVKETIRQIGARIVEEEIEE
jgi:hypothetical protein